MVFKDQRPYTTSYIRNKKKKTSERIASYCSRRQAIPIMVQYVHLKVIIVRREREREIVREIFVRFVRFCKLVLSAQDVSTDYLFRVEC
jgi:hypothetical protein